MKKRTRLGIFAALAALIATVAYAAAGDRTVTNDQSNKDLIFLIKKSSTLTEVMRLVGLTGQLSIGNGGYLEATSTNATTGTINDLAWTTPIVRFTGAGAVTLTGVVAQASGTHLTIHNDTGNVMTFQANGGSSTANRFLMDSTYDITINQNGMATFVYGNDRWRALSPDKSSGTCSVAVTGGTGFTTNWCTYERNGKAVSVVWEIQWSSPGASANLNLGGLPFTAKASTSQEVYCNLNGDTITHSTTGWKFPIGGNSTVIDWDKVTFSTGAGANVSNTDLASTGLMRCFTTYIAI